jgi:hypothetical protein
MTLRIRPVAGYRNQKAITKLGFLDKMLDLFEKTLFQFPPFLLRRPMKSALALVQNNAGCATMPMQPYLMGNCVKNWSLSGIRFLHSRVVNKRIQCIVIDVEIHSCHPSTLGRGK